jgi:dephospho-CoA kinase
MPTAPADRPTGPAPGQRKPVIGLVGGVGAGKSTVAAAMARRGGAVVDGDRLGHEALELPDVKRQLVGRWGPGVLKPDGTANRRAIAGIVFGDPAELKALEGMVFPHIGRRAREEIERAQADPAARFVVLDAAVMLEAGWAGACDRVVFVEAPREARVARLAARSRWTPAEVAAREAAQLPPEAKRAHADAVLVNDGTPARLQERVDRLLAEWGLMP